MLQKKFIGFLGIMSLTCAAQVPFDLDGGFQTSIQSQTIASLVPLANGKLMVAGLFDYPGAGNQLKLGRLDENGDWDITYSASSLGGGAITPWQDRFYVQSTTVVRRILDGGTMDAEFIEMNTGPYFQSGLGGDYFVYPDGRILMSGSHQLSDTARGYVGGYNLVWFSNQGYLDTTQVHRRCDGHIEYIHPLPDGKFLLGGLWSEYDGVALPNSTQLIRVHPDGALDTTFSCPISWSTASCHLALPDGRHLVGGTFRVQGDPDTLQLMRLLPDGAIDTTFNYHQQFLYAYASQPSYAGVLDLLSLDETRTLIVGGFTSIGNIQRGGIAIVDTVGTVLDGEFEGAGCGVWNDGFTDHGYIAGIVPAPDGSYYIHGSYHGYNDGTTDDPGQRMVSRLYGLDVGLPEQNTAHQWRVYPNPASNSFSLGTDGTGATNSVELLDALGRPVTRWGAVGERSLMAVGDRQRGIYTVRVTQRDGTIQYMKLVLE